MLVKQPLGFMAQCKIINSEVANFILVIDTVLRFQLLPGNDFREVLISCILPGVKLCMLAPMHHIDHGS